MGQKNSSQRQGKAIKPKAKNSWVSTITKLMVLLLHWFIPYKVERGKTYFQCGTKEFKPKAMQGNQAKRATKAKAKNSWVPTITSLKMK